MKTTMVIIAVWCSAYSLAAQELSFRELRSGHDAAYGVRKTMSTPEVVMARDDGELGRIWAEDFTGSHRDTTGLPAVNWEAEFVVAIFLGTRPSAGYTIRVQKVVRQGSCIEVTVKERKPAADDLSAQVLTSPYTVIACPRAGIPLEKVLMLKLISVDGGVLIERPAWSYRLMNVSPAVEVGKAQK